YAEGERDADLHSQGRNRASIRCQDTAVSGGDASHDQGAHHGYSSASPELDIRVIPPCNEKPSQSAGLRIANTELATWSPIPHNLLLSTAKASRRTRRSCAPSGSSMSPCDTHSP